jgi:hypothetical protein
MVDNALALHVKPLDVATPLMMASRLRQAETESRLNEFQMRQAALGAEARGLAPFANSPDFAQRWAEAADRLRSQGILDPQTHARIRSTPSPLMLESIIRSTSSPELQFRMQEATRAQRNQDRDFALREKQVDATLEGQRIPTGFRRAEGGTLEPVPGGPEDPALKARTVDAQVEARRRAVIAQGADPNDPSMRAYIMSGRMPREDQQPLTATDKKAILEGDEGVLAAENAISALQQAKQLSKKAYEGPLARQRGYLTSLVGNEGGQTTTELDNLIQSNALAQLKAIFGAAPTEGERKILLEIQGSTSQPDAVRQKIYDRAIQLAMRRLEFNKQRVNELRGGTFYKPSGTPPSATGKNQDRRPAGAAVPEPVEEGSTAPIVPNPVQTRRLIFNPETGQIE